MVRIDDLLGYDGDRCDVVLNLNHPQQTWLIITPFVKEIRGDPAYAANVFDCYNSFLVRLGLSER
jgi:hypothetical protein